MTATEGTTIPVYISPWLSRYGLILLCLLVWIACAFNPVDPLTWALEQIATVLVALAVWMQRGVRYSTSALVGLALLFCMHTIGTHFTYSLTPYDSVVEDLTGRSINELFGWERNQYDRLVHVLWGLCVTQPMFESLRQRLAVSDRAAKVLSFHLVLSTSALYELLEWSAALVFGDGSTAYVGMQGDVWDAQADIAVSLLGWGTVMILQLTPRLRRL